MFKNFSVYLQYVLPQHVLSILAGKLAECRKPWLKNWLIKRFIATYSIDMKLALIENPTDYATFNDFFIRKLKAELRPIDNDPSHLISPVDGTVAEIGQITQQKLIQAKGHEFDLTSLLGGDATLAQTFADGSFATLYLAPNNYHCVHMPLGGELKQVTYVPGKLFSVNRLTSMLIPNLYSRNERLITVFQTEAGPMAVIFVGAMIVGNIQTVWMQKPCRASHPFTQAYQGEITLPKGAELGHFNLGSTVILLFAKDRIDWAPELQSNAPLQFGQFVATPT